MQLIITLKDGDARYLRYLLGKKRKSKAELKTLVKMELLTILAEEARKEVNETGYASIEDKENKE